MKSSAIAVLVIVVILLIGVVGVIGTYNSMKVGQNAVDKAAADVNADLVRRMDLIPNLVTATKSYMKYESGVFTSIAEARAKIGQLNVNLRDSDADPEVLRQYMAAQNQLGGALSRLLAIAENYPELKASQTVTQLMDELAGTENRINVSRKRYNDAVQSLNNKIDTFPGNVVAGVFNIKRRVPFEAPEEAKTAPKIEL